MSYDDELKARLTLLRDELAAGKVVFVQDVADGMRDSLEAVKYGPDGQIDLNTVDSRIRSLASVVATMKYREEIKQQISLREIQAAYFESIENNFGEMYKNMLEVKAPPGGYASAIARNDQNTDYLYPIISKFMDELRNFWSDYLEIAIAHLQDSETVKGVFGGDLFPSASGNLVSTCGLYLDTIVLTDPFMNSIDLFPRWEKRQAVRYFVKHAMNVLTYKELALADVDPPIAVVIPYESSVNEDQKKLVGVWAEEDALIHGGKIFDRSFSTIDDFLEYGSQLDTPEKAAAAIADSRRVLFDVDWEEPIEQQLERGLKEFGMLSGASNAGQLIVAQCVGRMSQATDVLIKSNSLRGTPLIEAPTSWRYFNWKLEYDAPRDETNTPLHMSHGLQRAGNTDVEWLGKIPISDIIEMRKTGAAEEIRAVLADGIDQIAEANPLGFFRTADRIVDNIDNAFTKHQADLDEIKKKSLKFWGHDIGSWLVTGSIGVTAAITSIPALAVGALAADQVLGAPKLSEIPRKFKELKQAKDSLKRSPMGLFFRRRNS